MHQAHQTQNDWFRRRFVLSLRKALQRGGKHKERKKKWKMRATKRSFDWDSEREATRNTPRQVRKAREAPRKEHGKKIFRSDRSLSALGNSGLPEFGKRMTCHFLRSARALLLWQRRGLCAVSRVKACRLLRVVQPYCARGTFLISIRSDPSVRTTSTTVPRWLSTWIRWRLGVRR